MNTLEDFERFVKNNHMAFFGDPATSGSDMYCPPCGGYRRMNVKRLYCAAKKFVHRKHKSVAEAIEVGVYEHDLQAVPQLTPALMHYSCVQCETLFTAVLYRGAAGPALAVLPSVPAGVTTPHTPAVVAYYLDQAGKSQATGAHSAAVAMYRAALDQVLFDQGFEQRMCGQKIDELEKAIQDERAPNWARDLDTDHMWVLKRLADRALHADGGSDTSLSQFDLELVVVVQQTFEWLLKLIYELPGEKQERLGSLKAKLDAIEKNRSGSDTRSTE